MDKIPDYFRIALGEIGVAETSGKDSTERINEYLDSIDFPANDEIPWCSAFVNWCIERSNMKGTGSGLARSFLYWGKEIIQPHTGCITILRRGTLPWQGHVGFFLDDSPYYVYLLGGNQRNKVGVGHYIKENVISYRTYFNH
jgi:uncharacterized protein (TIGR02594 family)